MHLACLTCGYVPLHTPYQLLYHDTGDTLLSPTGQAIGIVYLLKCHMLSPNSHLLVFPDLVVYFGNYTQGISSYMIEE